MLVTFDCWLSFGKGNSGDSSVEVEITEEEYARLKKAEASGEAFGECEAVADIYDRVYAIAEAAATEDLIEADILDDEDEDEDEYESAGDVYYIGVNYPWFEDEE